MVQVPPLEVPEIDNSCHQQYSIPGKRGHLPYEYSFTNWSISSVEGAVTYGLPARLIIPHKTSAAFLLIYSFFRASSTFAVSEYSDLSHSFLNLLL